LCGIYRALQWWKLAFKLLSDSGARFPKWHATIHYFDQIIDYGVPFLLYNGSFEKAHRFLCKLPFLRTGMRKGNIWDLIMLRVALADRVVQLKTRLEAMRAKFNADGPPSGGADASDPSEQLTRLVTEFYPKKYSTEPSGPPSGSLDNNGYLNIPER
jgi:hypothetical protein